MSKPRHITRAALRRAQRLSTRVRRIIAGIAVAVAIVGVSIAIVPAADAATPGVGWGNWNNGTSGYYPYKGTFTTQSTGARSVCGEIGKAVPSSGDSYIGVQGTGWINANLSTSWGAHPNVNDNQVAGLNRVIQENVNTGDRNTAAALEFAVQSSLYGGYFDTSGNSHPSLWDLVNYTLVRSAGSANVNTITSIAQNLINEINSTTAGSGGTGSGLLQFTVSPRNNYNGTVTMNGTSGSTGTITLTNGKFLSTGTNTLNGAVEGASYQVTGVPPTTDGAPYKISGSGTFTAPGNSGYAPNVGVYLAASGQQSSLGVGGMVSNQPFNVSGIDPMERSTVFQPVLTTTATQFVARGDVPTDQVTFSTTADASGTNNPWFVSPSGNYAPILANGTLYGPFDTPPAQSTTVPAGAPVLGHATVTTSLQNGPNVAYTATSDTPAATSGYYTWVWSIDWNNQIAGVQATIPGPASGDPSQAPYFWSDDFGQSVETSVTPMRIAAVSQLTAPTIELSGQSTDTLTVTADGYWLKDSTGANIPITFRGTAYFVSGATAPSVSASPPAGATSLGSVTQIVTAPGQYTPPSITAPDASAGFITWVWQIRTADQPIAYRGYVEPWADQFGLGPETQSIAMPAVSTVAEPTAYAGRGFTDTATITGTLPVGGANLHFELYDGVKDSSGAWVCAAANLAWTSPVVAVSATGDVTSAPAPGQAPGTYNWVEVLTSNSGNVISRGACGASTEQTVVSAPAVTTSATAGSDLATAIGDVATVTGELPETGATLSFAAYRVPMTQTPNGSWAIDYPASSGTPAPTPSTPAPSAAPDPQAGATPDLSWACTPANEVFSDPGQLITTAGEHSSATFVPSEGGKYLWVETLTWQPPATSGGPTPAAVVLHSGTCGVLAETSHALTVTTHAATDDGTGTAAAGANLWDTASITGYVPEGSTVNFNLYVVKKGQAPVCDASTLVATLAPTTANPQPGGYFPAASPYSLTSEKWKNDVDFDSVGYFVAVVTDSLGRQVAAGECGDPNETANANAAVAFIAATGGFATTSVVVISGCIAALGAISLLMMRRYRRSRR